MDQIIFHSREEFETFYNANCDDIRRHWFYGPIECSDGSTYTLKEAYDDIMSMDDVTLFGTEDYLETEAYFEIWDVDEEEDTEAEEDYPF